MLLAWRWCGLQKGAECRTLPGGVESTLRVAHLEFVSRAKLTGAAVSCPWWLGRLDMRAGDPSQPLAPEHSLGHCQPLHRLHVCMHA